LYKFFLKLSVNMSGHRLPQVRNKRMAPMPVTDVVLQD